jgi:CDK inhibitor PHO81
VPASPIINTTADGANTLTIASLRGDYIHVVLQVTRDRHPVVFSDWLLPGVDFDIGVADVTLAQFEALAKSLGRSDIEPGSMDASARAAALSQSMISLDNLLKVSIILGNVQVLRLTF